MNIWAWAVVVAFCLSAFGKFTMLGTSNMMVRTPRTVALDLLIEVALIAWGLVVLL